MATTILSFTPAQAELPTSSGAQYAIQNNTLVLAFDGASAESAIFSAVMPQAYSAGVLTALITYRMASAITGDIDWDVAVEAVGDGEAGNADSFATANSTDNTTVPASNANIDVVSITLSSADSVAAGDMVRIKITRQGGDDTATGDAYVYHVEVRE